MKTATKNSKQQAAKSTAPNSVNGQLNSEGIDNECLPLVTENQPDFIDMLFTGRCHNCGLPIKRKTATGRAPKYCGQRCRSAAFRARRRAEKQAVQS